jgi:hypothetical protein
MGESDALRPLREMQALLARSVLSAVQVIRDAAPQHLLADAIRRLNGWMARVSGHTREEAQEPPARVGFPRVEVPAWWRLLEEFEGAYDQWAEALPDNWRNLSMTELEAVGRTMESTGWVLAWVPREQILVELIDSPDRRDAVSRLLTNQDHVLDDLNKGLGEVTDPSLADLSVALHQGVRSYQWGYFFPAQAIAAVVLTSLVKQQLETTEPGGSPLLAFRRNSLLRAGGTALNSYWPNPEDPLPSLFNPYATAHRLDLTHFNQANALGGLMLGVSFLRDLQAVADQQWR